MEKSDYCNKKSQKNFETALKNLDRVSEIALKLGAYPLDISRMKECGVKELRRHFLCNPLG